MMISSGVAHEEVHATIPIDFSGSRQRLSNTRRFHIFGVPIDRLSQVEAVARITSWIDKGNAGRLVFTPDTTALMRARHDSALRAAYQLADLVTADGTGVVWASQIFGVPVAERVTGIDLMAALCSNAERHEHRVFLLGSASGVAEKAKAKLLNKHPDLKIVGTEHGYFSGDEESELITRINQAKPDILFVGMGVPRQEKWLFENRHRLNVPVLMGVGGSFDVIAGHVSRAPLSWQKTGVEWLWRVIRQPERLGRVKAIPLFLMHLLFYKFLGWALNSV